MDDNPRIPQRGHFYLPCLALCALFCIKKRPKDSSLVLLQRATIHRREAEESLLDRPRMKIMNVRIKNRKYDAARAIERKTITCHASNLVIPGCLSSFLSLLFFLLFFSGPSCQPMGKGRRQGMSLWG